MSIWGGVLFTDKVKGFTLIELLAVIVILSIIALIVTPTILNLIEKAKYEGAKSSAMEYKEASEKAHLFHMMGKNKTIKESCSALKDKLTCGDKVLNLEIDGSLPSKGTVQFTKDGDVESITGLLINGYVFNYLNGVWTGKEYVPPRKAIKNDIGKYVKYSPDNATWNATRDGVRETKGKTSRTFNIYDEVTSSSINGKSKNESITCYNDSYTTKYSGWRIMDVDSNGQITLIHGGTPECYYYVSGQSIASKEILKVRATSASNEGEGKAWTKYGNSTYALSVHYMDSDDVNIINYEENGNEDYSLWDYLEKNERGNCYNNTSSYCGGNTELINIGSYYWLASANNTYNLYAWYPSNSSWGANASSYGVRPVVVLKSDVKLGTGSGAIGDEYELEVS